MAKETFSFSLISTQGSLAQTISPRFGEPTSSTPSSLSDQNLSAPLDKTTQLLELKNDSDLEQKKIAYKLIKQCHYDLRGVRFNITTYPKLSKACQGLDKLYTSFYSDFVLRRELEQSKESDNLDQFIDRNEALKFYNAAKKVFNELNAVKMLPEQAQESLEAVRQVILPTPIEEAECDTNSPEPNVILQPVPPTPISISDQNHSLPSVENESLTPIPESKKNKTISHIFIFFQKNPEIISKIPYALLPIPASILFTYIISLAHDSRIGANSIDTVNKFFNSKIRNASSFADGLKTPGVIYGLATLLTVSVFLGYLYGKYKPVKSEQEYSAAQSQDSLTQIVRKCDYSSV